MNHPVLDPRGLEEIRAQVKALARSYTPEWRFENSADDPGAALAELFSTMFYQTVDRVNALPEKLYIEFLNQIGFQEPGPVPARGEMQFNPPDTITEPVAVPSGTEVFTQDESGDNIVYETQRSIGATSAQLQDLYYVDSQNDLLQRLNLDQPGAFFAPGGEDIQSHVFYLSENCVLRLDGPCTIEVNLSQTVRYLGQETARLLVGEGMRWSYRHGGVWLPFDEVRAEGDRVMLEKRSSLALEPDEEGRISICCQGRLPMALTLQKAELSSAPLTPCKAQRLFNGDVPIEASEGGYCFGRRPSVYNVFYVGCDAVLTKRGARAMLHLEIEPVVYEPDSQNQGLNYLFTQPIIDKRSAVAVKPNDVWVAEVVWEYYNGAGWCRLNVAGSRNPFSCRQEGPYELTFQVPQDIQPVEVNAEEGYYIRARVAEMENIFSVYQRWVVPFCKGAELSWQYAEPVPVDWAASDNNGMHREISGAKALSDLQFTVLEPLAPGQPAVYFRFDRSPDGMPLSVYFQVKGRAMVNAQLVWECWNGKAFEAVRAVDETEQLMHSGSMFLFLPDALPRRTLFGAEGCWLRLSRTGSRAGRAPVVEAVKLNVAPALQCRQEPEQRFDTGHYDAGKVAQLLSSPVQGCTVWVDELEGLAVAEAEDLGREQPDKVQLEWENHILRRCWVRWEETADLSLAGSEDRVYTLDPYQGIVKFGDGCQGRVPPAGNRNIRIQYSSGGGARGNVPAGAVNAPLGGLARISHLQNITSMSGGADRLSLDEIEDRGSRHLRTRGRAAGSRDFEDLVHQRFPEVKHVRCFGGRGQDGQPQPGHVTVVLTGISTASEDNEALCRQVYQYLSSRCSCCLAAEGRLHVRPVALMRVNTRILVELEHPEQAADTQQAVNRRIQQLIGETWYSRPIGSQVRMDELWSTVRETPNVRRVIRLLAEGSYDEGGQARLVPLEGNSSFLYAVVESGTHVVRAQ